MRLLTIALLVAVGAALTSGQVTLTRQTCTSDKRYMDLQASPQTQAMLGGLMAVRQQAASGIGCGAPSFNTMQAVEAARYTLQTLNASNFIPNVRLGMRLYDTCSSTEQAMRSAEMFLPQIASSPSYCSNSSSQLSLGLVGPMYSEAAMGVGRMVAPLPAIAIATRASSDSLSDKRTYPTTLRTFPSATSHAKAIVAVMKNVQWNRALVVYEDSSMGRSGLDALLNEAFQQSVCIVQALMLSPKVDDEGIRTRLASLSAQADAVVLWTTEYLAARVMTALNADLTTYGRFQWILPAFSLNTKLNNINYALGMLVVKPRTRTLNSFLQTWNRQTYSTLPADNPWIQDWFRAEYNCDNTGGLNDCTRATWVAQMQEETVDSTVMAIYAYASALKAAINERCPFKDVCDSVRNMSPATFAQTYIFGKTFQVDQTAFPGWNLTYTFDSNGDLLLSEYTVYNYQSTNAGTNVFQTVGSFANNQLTMSTPVFYNTQRSQAVPSVTSPCPSQGCRNCLLPTRNVYYDYVPGTVLLGMLTDAHKQGRDPLTCGDLSASSVQAWLAARYALEQVSRMTSLLPGVSLGAVMADICSSDLLAQSFLSGMLSGMTTLRDSSGQTIDANRVRAFVDFTSTPVAMAVSRVLGDWAIPEVQAGATGDQLRDRTLYPSFSRNVPSDRVLANAAVAVLQKLKWDYVQVIYHSSLRMAAMDFKQQAARASICVPTMLEIGSDYSDLVRRLRMNRQARGVVVYGDDGTATGLFQALRGLGAASEFTFLSATEQWGDGLPADYRAEAEGTFYLKLGGSPRADFEAWMAQVSMATVRSIPALSQWYQSLHNCSLDASSRGLYSAPCGSSSITASPRYTQSQYAGYVIDAVYATAYALDAALRMYCGANYRGLCSQFRGSADVKGMLLQYIRNITFTSSNNQQVSLRDGESTATIEVMQQQATGSAFRVGEYSSSSMMMTSWSIRTVPQSTCQGRCSECYYVTQAGAHVLVPGDVMLGGIFSISNPVTPSQGPYLCGDVKTSDGYQFAAAMLYALKRVNQDRYPVSLGNISLGALVLDHCNTPARSDALLSGLYAGQSDPAWSPMAGSFLTDRLMAWLTDITVSGQEVAELLQPMKLPVVSPSATSRSLMAFQDFYRTVQGDDTVAQAMLKLVKALNHNYVQVVHSANAYGRGGATAVQGAAQQLGMCVTGVHEVSVNNSAGLVVSRLLASTVHVVVLYLGPADAAQFLAAANASNLLLITPEPYTQVVRTSQGNPLVKMMSVRLRSPELADFRDFLNARVSTAASADPLLQEYYQNLHQCNLPGSSRYDRACTQTLTPLTSTSAWRQSDFVLSTVNAVYAVATALDATLTQLCGRDYAGFCSNFSGPGTRDLLLRNLALVNFRDEAGRDFRFIDREGNSVYDILHFDGAVFNTVGTYAGATLQMNFASVFAGVQSRCDPPCLECIQRGVNFSYVPGDLLLGGLFDVHERDVNPFSCGQINTLHGLQLLEAFHFALRTVNAKQGIFTDILPGVTLGGVGLDSCQSAVRTGYLVSNVHNGLTQLARNGDVINPANIDAYIGAYSSDRTLYLARILTALKLPLISYAASSTELLDQFRYPYFYRTVPADDNQARAMASFLNHYNIRYVQILHTSTSYGQRGAAAFRQMADMYKICVSQTVIFPDNGTASQESANDVVNMLLQKQVANTVILFADSQYVRALLQAISRVPRALEKFRFIGSETWAVNEDAILGVEDNALDSVTLNLESKELSTFEDYLSAKTADDAQENPWFPEYYQKILDCYLSLPDPRYSRRCDQTSGSVKSHYKQDPGVVHVINAVYSAAFALHGALQESCGSAYRGVCESYRNRPERQLALLRHLQNVTFQDPTGAQFSFTERREGRKGYDFFSVEKLLVSGFTYTKVGSFSADGNLTTEPSYTPAWSGSCSREGACSECPTIRNQGIRYAVSGRQAADTLTVVGVFDVHDKGADDYRCGPLSLHGGFQHYLAFSYFVDMVATRLNMPVRGLTLDTCSNPIRTDQDLYSLLADMNLCNSIFDASTGIGLNVIGGVVTPGDAVTMAAGRVLEPLSISYVSSSATSLRFDNRGEYSWLARAISPHSHMYRVLASLLRSRGWDYVSAIYSDAMLADFQSFAAAGSGSNLCLGSSSRLSPSATANDVDSALADVQQAFFSKVVVLFTSPGETRLLLQAARDRGVLSQYLWVIANPDYSAMSRLDAELSSLPANSRFTFLSLELRTTTVSSFVNYTASIRYDGSNAQRNSHGIPRQWFEEFYQNIHQCYLQDALERASFPTMCTKSEAITASMIKEDRYLLNTLAAVDAMVQGMRLVCPSNTATSDSACLQRASTRGLILNATLGVSRSLDADLPLPPNTETFSLSFNSQRYWEQGFRITRSIYDTTGPLTATHTPVGTWSGQFSFSVPNFVSVTSQCPQDAACACVQVSSQTGAQTDSGPRRPLEPRNYFLYADDVTLVKTYTWPVWAIVVAIFTCIGLLLALLAFFFLLISYPIRGGTTALAFLSQLGIMGIYAISFAFFVQASEASCGARRFVMGVVYAIVFACLLVKAIDNWRHRDSAYSNSSYSGVTSSLALLLVAIGIILVQVIIPIMWLILVPPGAEWMGPATGIQHDWWWCTPTHFYDVGLVLSFLFVICLVIVTAIFAAMAWDCPANMYESRWILYSAISTAGCFLVWMIVTTNAGPPYRDACVTIANVINATCLLITGPLRKIVLLFQVRAHEKKATESHEYNEEYLYSNTAFDPDADYGYQQESKAGSDVGF